MNLTISGPFTVWIFGGKTIGGAVVVTKIIDAVNLILSLTVVVIG